QFICSRLVRRDKQLAETAVYLFAVSSPRQANHRNSRLSVRGEFSVASKSPEKPFIFSRCARRDKQTAETAVYLFTARLLIKKSVACVITHDHGFHFFFLFRFYILLYLLFLLHPQLHHPNHYLHLFYLFQILLLQLFPLLQFRPLQHLPNHFLL